MRHFDCVVIGSGPAGQKAAIQAAKLGKRVCVVEKNPVLGDAAVNTGTIPSKALREAVLHLTGATKRGLFGEQSRVKKHITIDDLIYVSRQVVQHEISLVRSHCDRNEIELTWGEARFESPTIVQVTHDTETEQISADKFFIATGTRPAMPASIPFDHKGIFTSDGLIKIGQLPKSMIVVGGGVIGTEYACMMAALDVKVTLIEGRNEVLGFLDREISEALMYQMRRTGITLRLGEKVSRIEAPKRAHDTPKLGGTIPWSRQSSNRERSFALKLSSMPSAARARPVRSNWTRWGWRLTIASGCISMPPIARRLITFTPSGMSSVFPPWPPQQWNRDVWPPVTPTAHLPARCLSFSLTGGLRP